ncbi:hypothetical protein SAMN06265379_101291 [Saccharicrinis carchari]|uniref:Uncharacterized protein n=1 Tax=Saccharicrinis carchari TaxID=1168039 RepID=A0A521AP75_SACCC|nr:hypothetical protein SAMN06265379_101291 [Saccharicrinis carchari]
MKKKHHLRFYKDNSSDGMDCKGFIGFSRLEN